MSEYNEVIIDTEEIKEYFLTKLINRGYIPRDDEIDTIGDIAFDFMINKGIIEEVHGE